MSEAGPLRDRLEAVLKATRHARSPIEVSGTGPLADQLRDQVQEAGSQEVRPGTVIDTTGDLLELQRLMERVDDLGTVILAGPPLPDQAAVDLYADLHVRGLTVIGLPAGCERRK